MRLTERYRPRTLANVVGQPCIKRYLMPLVRSPEPSCWLLVGNGGTGKTAAAYALASDLGIDSLWDCHHVCASELDIDRCRAMWGGMLRYVPRNGWIVLVLEELDALPSEQVHRFLKDNLQSQRMAEQTPHLIVVATSNDISGLSAAFLQRWQVCQFEHGAKFAAAMRQRLQSVWAEVAPDTELPPEWRNWGKDGEGWSMRVALDELENHLSAVTAQECAA